MQRNTMLLPVLLALACNGEPTRDGRTLTQALERLHSSEPAERLEAARAIASFAEEAGQSGRSETFEAHLPALLKALDDPYAPVRRYVATTLGKLPPLAVAAMPRLIRMAGTEEDARARAHAVYALGWAPAGQLAEVLPLLGEALQHPDDRVRARSAEALARIGPAASSALPVLRKQLRDDPGYAQRYYQEALTRIEPQAQTQPAASPAGSAGAPP
jgi:HEAT repeat protein